MHEGEQTIVILRSGECVKVFPAIVKSNVDGVCVEARIDSPVTPLPKQLTASTTSSHSSMEVVG